MKDSLMNLMNVTTSTFVQNEVFVPPNPFINVIGRKVSWQNIQTDDPIQRTGFSVNQQIGDIITTAAKDFKNITLDSYAFYQHPVYKICFLATGNNFVPKGKIRFEQNWLPIDDEDISFLENNYYAENCPLAAAYTKMGLQDEPIFDWANRKLTRTIDISRATRNQWLDADMYWALKMDNIVTFETEYKIYCNMFPNHTDDLYWKSKSIYLDPETITTYDVSPISLKTWVQVMDGSVSINGVEHSEYSSLIVPGTSIQFATTSSTAYIVVREKMDAPAVTF